MLGSARWRDCGTFSAFTNAAAYGSRQRFGLVALHGAPDLVQVLVARLRELRGRLVEPGLC
jgi:hypothetical protein